MAHELETKKEEERQQLLIATNTGTLQKLDQAVADHDCPKLSQG
jgi:hypothetical protein